MPIGVVAGLGAAAFYYLITVVSQALLTGVAGLTLPVDGTLNPAQLAWASSLPRLFWIPGLMVGGGLFVGFVAWKLAPEIAGHGTDATIRSFHRQAGAVRLRVPILKALTSAVTLGTGGSGGREGPVSQIGGGFGSMWANLVGLSDRDRRIALASGMGAGIGAIFRAPLGGAVYAAEILYLGDFEPEVFVPGIIASVVAYSVYSSIFGFHTLFATSAAFANYAFNPERLPLYLVLGIACGAAGIFFTWMYQRGDRWFGSRPWARPWGPAIGAGLASAVFVGTYFLLPEQGHFASLSSLSIGYGFVQVAVAGDLGAFTYGLIGLLIAAVVIRMVMTTFVVGSGGSAGLFGTSVVVGAFLGTAIGGTFHVLLPSLVPTSIVAVFAIVGMMSFFGGISKAPLGVLIMVVEMAGSYAVLPAAMMSIFVAYVVTGPYHIYSEQLPSRLQSPAHREEYQSYFLATTTIGEIARYDSEPVPPSMSVADAIDVAVTHGRAVLSVESSGAWHGALRLSELLNVPPEKRGELRAADLARPVDLVLPADLTAHESLRRMEERATDVAAVIAVDGPSRVLGLVTRRGLRAPDSLLPHPPSGP